MCGDFNVAVEPLDLARPKENEGNAGYSIEERDSFKKILESGFVDSFRLLHPDSKEYSWWSYMFHAREKNVGWRLDYFLISEWAKDKIKISKMHPEVFGSDHCPIEIEFEA